MFFKEILLVICVIRPEVKNNVLLQQITSNLINQAESFFPQTVVFPQRV